jgi:hypothetical protein
MPPKGSVPSFSEAFSRRDPEESRRTLPGLCRGLPLFGREITGPGSHVELAVSGNGDFHPYLPKGIRSVCFLRNKSERVLFAKIACDSLGDVCHTFQGRREECDPAGIFAEPSKHIRIFFLISVHQADGINHHLR